METDETLLMIQVTSQGTAANHPRQFLKRKKNIKQDFWLLLNGRELNIENMVFLPTISANCKSERFNFSLKIKSLFIYTFFLIMTLS